jgi:hypothetical protein
MECYQCLQDGVTREAAGLCHHCSAALCADHIVMVEEPLMIRRSLAPATIPPKKDRLYQLPLFISQFPTDCHPSPRRRLEQIQFRRSLHWKCS